MEIAEPTWQVALKGVFGFLAFAFAFAWILLKKRSSPLQRARLLRISSLFFFLLYFVLSESKFAMGVGPFDSAFWASLRPPLYSKIVQWREHLFFWEISLFVMLMLVPACIYEKRRRKRKLLEGEQQASPTEGANAPSN